MKEKILHLPLIPTVLASLRETASLYTTHYSKKIEGNRLEPNQIEAVLKHEGHFPGRTRDEGEVKGYYVALQQVEKWASKKAPLTEHMIQILRGLVMSDRRTRIKPSLYRDGQNVTRDSVTHGIVYMPPEAKDVPKLMMGS
jgi:Fic family protein